MNSRSLTVVLVFFTMMTWLTFGGLANQTKASPHAASESGMSAPQRSTLSIEIPSDANQASAKSKNAVSLIAGMKSLEHLSIRYRASVESPKHKLLNEQVLISLRI